MTSRPILWDRIAGAARPVPEGTVLLGRYGIPEGKRRYAINRVAVAAGSYFAAGTGTWSLRDGVERWRGDFGADSVPPSIVLESVAVIAAKVRSLRQRGAPLSDWQEVPPMVNGVSQRLHPQRLEERLRAELRYLRAVCGDPHARLRTEHVLVPVSQARRNTWRTVAYLAAHSETWEARRLHGVEPAKLLTPLQSADHDLYENRVVATLLDRLWRYVLVRSAEIDAIDSMVRQGQSLLDQAEMRPDWRQKKRLYAFIAELIEQDDLAGRIANRRIELTALRGALAPLLTSRLRTRVGGPYSGPPRLRPTNLFDNHVSYRHCRRLWDDEVASRQGTDDQNDPVEALAGWCRDFAHYSLTLALRAVEQLGLVATTTDRPEIGKPGPQFTYRAHQVRLDWNRDDTFSLLLDGRPILRMVPLPHALTRQAELIDHHLHSLRPAAGYRTAVLYPGDPFERDKLPLVQRLAVHSSSGTSIRPAMAPVSPADLGSIGRVARTIRGALDERIMLDYPAHVPCRVPGASSLARRFGWLDWRDGRLLVICPPASYELTQLGAALDELRTHADAARQQGDNKEDLRRLHESLLTAVDQIGKLTICPVCGHRPESPSTEFVPRADDTYICRCTNSSCNSVYELRRCSAKSCKERYPVLTVPSSAGQLGGHGDLLDQRFSQDLLAVPCWQTARSYICRLCGACPEATGTACDRCTRDKPGT
jgi:hypothetical protein